MRAFLVGICVIGFGALIGVGIANLLPASRPTWVDPALLRGMVSEAATFGWRCHERGTEAECAAAVLQVIGGTP